MVDLHDTDPAKKKLILSSQFALLDVQRATRCNFCGGYRNNSGIFHIVFHLTVENRVTELERLLRAQEDHLEYPRDSDRNTRQRQFWRMSTLADILII